jgi:hypothetical protein
VLGPGEGAEDGDVGGDEQPDDHRRLTQPGH